MKVRPAKALVRLTSHIGFQGRPLTTRARWINHILTAFLNLSERTLQTKPVKAPIYILGTGRSGTTILGKVLSMHHDVGWLNEPKLLWHMAYPYEDLIGNYSQGPAYYRLDASQATEDVRRTIHQLYGVYLATTRSRRVVDKYPEMIFRTEFLQALFPDAKFIFLVRNGWDTIRSIEQWSRRFVCEKNEQIHDWWGVDRRKWRLLNEQVVANNPLFAEVCNDVASFTQQTDMAAVEWIATMQEGIRLLKKTPQKIHVVHYEALASHPTDILAQVMDFCELAPDDVFSSYAQRALRPALPKEAPSLHPAIQPLFSQTMKAMGYEC